MKTFELKAAREGFAAGVPFAVDTAAKKGVSPSGKPEAEKELARFRDAAAWLDRELFLAGKRADRDSAAIYEAERMLLGDQTYTGAVEALIRRDGLDAVSALRKAGQALERQLGSSENEYIRGRTDDVRGLSERLLAFLVGEAADQPLKPSILVAGELSPARLSAIDSAMILGILTEKGSPASHVSILAGNLGVPCLYGSAEAVAAARTCGRLILDGQKLITDPDEDLYRAALVRMEEERKKRERQNTPAMPEGNTRTVVLANITGPRDLPELVASGAQGVGLFRSEFLFLDRADAPSEEEQFEAYRRVAEAMGEKETVIRTLDLGSDKQASWLSQPEEKNPALGCRGLRLCLAHQDLFRAQLRALLRAAVYGHVKIMLPMVTSVREVEAARALMNEVAAELSSEGTPYAVPPLGVMIETPAAALTAEKLADHADFFSIGTNDLTQYTLALDREAQGLDDYYDPYHESIFRLIEMTAAAGHRKKIPTSVCGELAADPRALERLLRCGVDRLSVSIFRIAETKRLVAEAEKKLDAARSEREERTIPPSLRRQAEKRLYQPHEEQAEKDLPRAGEERTDDDAPPQRMLSFAAPVDGTLIPMEEIPDSVFSSGTMGECVGIMPENGAILAPCDGVVSAVAQAGHAIGFTASDGREILVHVGIDTVRMGGKGFRVLVREGNAVSKGDPVMEADLDLIREAGLSPMVIVAVSRK